MRRPGAKIASQLLIWSAVVMMVAKPAQAIDPIEGDARVLRADILAIGGARVKLQGILPPEESEICGDQSCIDAAMARLGEIVAGHQVTCSRDKRLQHGLYSGICALEDGHDPAAELLRAGLARLGTDRMSSYAQASSYAATTKLGVFSK